MGAQYQHRNRKQKPASDLKFCSCRMCRWGKHTKAGSKDVQAIRRSYRRRVKQLLHQGEFDVPEKAWVPYTD